MHEGWGLGERQRGVTGERKAEEVMGRGRVVTSREREVTGRERAMTGRRGWSQVGRG